jgi:pSer/pThr/pTyr-binding forkhead associated (FHA) protein
MDLNSSNKTYINGQRVHPHEVRALRDGDELRLGKIIFTVAFKPQ